jgi:hypothetical protein
MNKKTVKSWKKFILNQKGLTVKEYLDFINSVTYSVLTQKDVVYLSDELQMDPINFWTINRLSHLEISQVKEIISFSRSVDIISPLLDIPTQDRQSIISTYKKDSISSGVFHDSFFKAIDKARDKKTNLLTPEGVLADQVIKKVWKAIALETPKWIFKITEKDQKRLSKLSLHKKVKDTEYNWAAGVCINAIKLGDITYTEDGGSPAANYLYGQFSDYI